MGQSQSLHEKQKEIPHKPTKVFGFIFYQMDYSRVKKERNKEKALSKYV